MTREEENQSAIEWIEGLRDRWNDKDNVKYCNMAIKALEQTEPERKMGKWKHMVGFWECDQCHAEYTGMPTCMGKVIYEYCPMCGAKMEYNGE